MFWTRVFSGIVLLIILATVFVSGGAILGGFLGVISFIGLYEFYRAVKILPDGKKCDLLTMVGYLGCVALYGGIIGRLDIKYVLLVIAVVCIAMLAVYVFTFPKYEASQVVYSLFGFIYVPVLLAFVYYVRALTEGIFIVWLIFMSSWICDIFAYCVGMLFGKHKLAPKLSPKKSIEGSVGGVVFSALFGGAYGYFIKGYITSDINVIVAFVVLCAVGACVSQVGDLAASAIKRNNDIKDYGHLIPGHGGILDRFDSVIFTAPMVYIVALFFI